jgi:hypothetical protein
MSTAKKIPVLLKFLAHFERGGQDILAKDHNEAVRKGEAAARRRGTFLRDVTGPDEEEDS